jgi:hypothetical protein
MNNEIGMDSEGNGCALHHFGMSEGTERNHEKSSVRIVGVPASFQTEHLPNTNLERYCYTVLFGFSAFMKRPNI